MSRLHLVDGTYELFRAHFSKRPSHSGPGGKDLKATVGIASSLLALLHDDTEAVTHIAVAFDNPIRSFRNDLFDGYKTEEGVPPELLAQFDDAEEATRALGVTVWSMKEFEADDALASAAIRYQAEVEQVRIFTPDKDLNQVVRGDRVVQVDPVRQKLINEEHVRKNKGVAPESIPDLLALIGDTADGIPGLDGWGEKGAAAVLSVYEHLEKIPADVRAWTAKPRGAEKLSATFNANREDALLYRTLATLRHDAPINKTLEEIRFNGVPREQFLAWCDKCAVTTLKSRPTRWA
ncbi:MAG: 5'-3' exonuclease H3TH domain-containing protein [Myxococcaceae bacterium]